MNLIQIMADLPKSEEKILAQISNSFTHSEFIAEIDVKAMPMNQRGHMFRYLKKLRQKNLVRDVGTNKYMINPHLLIPSSAKAEKEALLIWEISA